MVMIGVIGARMLGIFEPFELFLLDAFFKQRPHEPIDSRIVVVTVDEEDLRQLAQWPISDAILAQVLGNINSQNPRLIALDIYRDFPVEPGSQQLLDIFTSTPHLVGIEQVGEIQVGPPPELAIRNQVGLSNLLIDSDGKVRRSLLSVNQDNTVQFGLAAFAALQYLNQEDIILQPQSLAKGTFRLGDTIFTSLSPFAGGYGNFDGHGYQIMLNYRKPLQPFQTLSIIDAIENRIPSNLIHDRIVFIGVTASSLNDTFLTPYGISNLPEMSHAAGVEIHAQITSQILSAALDDRPLLNVLPTIVECFSIIGFTVLGVRIAMIHPKSHHDVCSSIIENIVIYLGFISGITIGLSYITFLFGWWIPVASSLISLLAATSLGVIWQNQILKHLAYLDGLTQVANRRCFDQYLDTKISRQSNTSIILCDIDYFKHFNDSYGHQAGDECLIRVAQALKKATRPSDFIARYGGEEFAVILPNTPLKMAIQIAERIRKHVVMLCIPHQMSDVSEFVSLSCGVANVSNSNIQSSKELIEAADNALYTAKITGRNCVITFDAEKSG